VPVKKRALSGFDYSDCVLPSNFDKDSFESNRVVPTSQSFQSQPAQSNVVKSKVVKPKVVQSKHAQSKVVKPKVVQSKPKYSKLVVPLSDRVLRKKH